MINFATEKSTFKGGINGPIYLTIAFKSLPLSALDKVKITLSLTIRGTVGLLPSQIFAESTISFLSYKTIFSNSLNPQLIILSASIALSYVPSIPFKTNTSLLPFCMADATTP